MRDEGKCDLRRRLKSSVSLCVCVCGCVGVGVCVCAHACLVVIWDIEVA